MLADPDTTPPKSVISAEMSDKRPLKRKQVGGEGHRISKSRRTGADSLSWKTVPMPDRMDDYGGFLGLEEVGDVDVVRDEITGQYSFREKFPQKNDVDDEPEDKLTKSISKRPASPRKAQHAESRNSAFSALPSTRSEENVDVSAWQPLKLSPDTLASLATLKFSKPTPIQESAIPEILAGHDVVGKASTGSGKTLAFAIPILEHFLESHGARSRSLNGGKRVEKTPLALILSPTRELAHQLDKHLTALCSNGAFDGPSVATLTGGLSVQKQQRLLKTADIVIGTPGRLWEVISSGQGLMKALKQIQFLVIDEADRLLSEGHFKEVEEILNALDRQEQDGDSKSVINSKPDRQTLVFSATFDRNLQQRLSTKASMKSDNLLNNKESLAYLLSKLNFREPHPNFIDVNPINQLATGLKEGLVECGGMEKDLYLYALLLLHPKTRTLVFVNSISAAKRLTPFLQNLNLPALALQSGMPQKARLRSIERFTQTNTPENQTPCSILVATDVAARGLDIPNVQLIIHYHLPRAADTYVHRSGRTARAGLEGSSVLICAPEEVAGVRRLVAKVHAQGEKQGGFIRTLDIDRRVVSRLKGRASLAKTLADTTLAKGKRNKESDFFREAAEDLGVDLDSDFEVEAKGGRRGRGGGRQKKEKELVQLSKADVGRLRGELKGLLKQRVNVGVSEKYLTKGGVDVGELLSNKESTGREFLGNVGSLW